MKKIIDYIKTNYLYVLLLIIIIPLLILPFYKRGRITYSLNEDNPVTIVCPENATKGQNIECAITLSTDKSILSVNANYELPTGIEYSSFSVDTTCTGENCYEIYASTENGFAVGNPNGVPGTSTVGKLFIKMPENATAGSKITITLKNIELSNSEFEMIQVDNTSSEITIIDNNTDLFDDSLIVDEKNKIIKKILLHTKYGQLKSAINSNATIVIESNDNNQVNDESKIKTGDKIIITLNNATETYTLSVFGDVTGDGEIEMDDVGRLYRHTKQRKLITDEAQLASADVKYDEAIDIGDVGKIYRFFKNNINKNGVLR